MGPQKLSENGPRRLISGVMAVTIAIVILLVIILIVGPLTLIAYRSVDVDKEVSVHTFTGAKNIYLNVTATIGTMEVTFAHLKGAAVEVLAMVNGTSTYFGSEDPTAVNMTSALINGTQVVNCDIDTYAPWPSYSLSEANYDVVVDPSLPVYLNLSMTTGGISVKTSSDTILNGISISATKNPSAIDLVNGTELKGNAIIRTATGGSTLTIQNVSLVNDPSFYVNETSGPINIIIDQDRDASGNLSLFAKDILGGISLNLDIRGNNSALVSCQGTIGGSTLSNDGGFNGTSASFRSNNYPSQSECNVQLKDTTGKISSTAHWSSG